MLQFILGASGSGKTTLIHNMIQEQSKDENSKIMLIVPEQFTYETEKSLFKQLGAEQFMRVQVTSFTRFASEVFKQYGGIAGEYASEPAKTILMDMAIHEVRDMLDIYQKASKNKTFSTTMLDTVTELKNAGVTPKELSTVAIQTAGYLNKKASEIALIYATYSALLETTYLDSLDDIMRATKKLEGINFFEHYTVYFDAFKGFTANENDLIKMIFRSARQVYVSLCLDLKRANESDVSVFASVKDTYEKLKRFATQIDTKIKPSILLTEQKRFHSPELTHLEQNLFSPVIKQYAEKNNAIKAVLCKNEYDEVEYVLSEIAELVQDKQYSYHDIVIISRDLDTYMSKLEVAFQKYKIPYYADTRSTIITKPLIQFLSNAINCITRGYQSEDILGLLKCGLTNFSIEEIAELENYIYIWGVKGKQWFMPFVSNPRGYKESFTNEDTESLERINTVRSFVTLHLQKLANGMNHTTGRQICTAIITFINELEIKENTQSLINSLKQSDLAGEYLRVWNILIELVDTMAITIGETIVSPKRFDQLFSLVAQSYTMGSLPQSLDCVIVGSADRIRTNAKKAVFVLGVNENVMPYLPSTGGAFTDKEREQLISLDVEIAPPTKNRILEERFIAYQTVCSANERLYLTARKTDIAGKSMSPSILFSQLKKMFSEEIVIDTQDFDGLFFCKNKGSAFSYLAKTFFDDTSLTASLKQALNEDEWYHQKLLSLEKVADKKPFQIRNEKNAKALFGEKMNISPTRVEGFYQCHFRYFLEHGLRVHPLRKAELNPLETGTLIHSIIYSISKQVDLKSSFDELQIKQTIKQELDLYIEQVMGGVLDKTKRFLYLYHRMRQSIYKIIEQLCIELSQSGFTPCDFEYEIAEQNDITPLVLTSEGGATITVAGKIDRIDRYTSINGENYIRIVDYKSGKKLFKLNDVLYGLNLQMLLYLSCVSQNGKGSYQNSLPAGILYMPAGEQTPSLPRHADEIDAKNLNADFYKMNGLFLENDDVLNAMDQGLKGVFIPVSLKKDGSFTSASLNSLVTLKELGKINSYINKLIINMANELHQGKIEAQPIQNSCDYCNYNGVCGVNPKDTCKEYIKYDKQEILNQMSLSDETGEGEQ